MQPDLINGLFETAAGILLWNNVRVLFKDKKVRGYSGMAVIFFCLWGYWNLFYYPSLGQWFSFLGGLNVVLANTVWVGLMLKYRNN